MQSDDRSAALPSALRSEQDLLEMVPNTKQLAALNERLIDLELENKELRRRQGLPDDRLVKLSMIVKAGSADYQTLRRALIAGDIRGKRLSPLMVWVNSALAHCEALGLALPPILQKARADRDRRVVEEAKKRWS